MQRFYNEICELVSDKEKLNKKIKDLVFEICVDEFKNTDDKTQKSAELANEFLKDLDKLEILDKQTLEITLKSIKNALISDEEHYLFKLLYEFEKLKKQIGAQKDEIKEISAKSFKSIENSIKNTDLSKKDEIMNFINDIFIDELEMKGILKEVSESAFVSAIENAEDVLETSYEISKNLVYHAILEGEFNKVRILGICKVIMKSAISIANESKIFADELINGAIKGANDAITKCIEKFQNDLKFAPDEIIENFNKNKAELDTLESDFISLLRSFGAHVNDPAKSVINEILQNDYDSFLAKFKRVSSDFSAAISQKIDELNLEDLSKNISAKFDEIRQEISQKSSQIAQNLEIDEKISNIKKEISELEKIASQNISGKVKNISEKAKELGTRAFNAAKNSIKKK